MALGSCRAPAVPALQRGLTGSRWDHVGVLLFRDRQQRVCAASECGSGGSIGVIECDAAGTKFYSLRNYELAWHKQYDEICVRPLLWPGRGTACPEARAFIQRLAEWYESVLGAPYELSLRKLFAKGSEASRGDGTDGGGGGDGDGGGDGGDDGGGRGGGGGGGDGGGNDSGGGLDGAGLGSGSNGRVASHSSVGDGGHSARAGSSSSGGGGGHNSRLVRELATSKRGGAVDDDGVSPGGDACEDTHDTESASDESEATAERGFFCSELVAHAYQAIGVLPVEGRPASGYWPVHFGEDAKHALPLTGGVSLGAEVPIEFTTPAVDEMRESESR
jgi:hypothetical protein